jgi:EF-P beta-lysylation protein EpmB
MTLPRHKPEPSIWRTILRKNFTNLDAISDFLQLSQDERQKLAASHFTLNVPMRLACKMTKQTLDDPIARQFLPLIEEKNKDSHFVSDPVGDELCRKEPKLLHKYEGRVLIVCTSACAMHCRYCFRQNFSYDVSNKSFTAEITLIKNDSSIHEVILSGGDPLSLSDDLLGDLLEQLATIPHVRRVRFHTRFQIGIPERIDEGFLKTLARFPRQIIFVFQINHPKELDADVIASIKALQHQGCMTLNQAVLLKDVNDDVETLKELFETLVDQGVLPYYLHQLDRVQGTAHYEVSEDRGRELIHQLTKLLPGYAVPKYVREIAGEPNKTGLL